MGRKRLLGRLSNMAPIFFQFGLLLVLILVEARNNFRSVGFMSAGESGSNCGEGRPGVGVVTICW